MLIIADFINKSPLNPENYDLLGKYIHNKIPDNEQFVINPVTAYEVYKIGDSLNAKKPTCIEAIRKDMKVK